MIKLFVPEDRYPRKSSGGFSCRNFMFMVISAHRHAKRAGARNCGRGSSNRRASFSRARRRDFYLNRRAAAHAARSCAKTDSTWLGLGGLAAGVAGTRLDAA